MAGIGATAGCSGGSRNGTPATDSEPAQATDGGTPTDADASGGAGLSGGQVAKLAANDGGEQDEFGWSVAMSDDGTTALVGANFDSNFNGDFAGSVYVFTESEGSWSQQAKLTATDGDGSDNFGHSVALSADGTTALIGAVGDEGDGYGSDPEGSAYIFEQSDTLWRQQSKLTAEDDGDGDRFGNSVALSADGTTALIGAEDDEDPNGDFAGSGYVFEASGRSWDQRAKLAADDGDRADHFGSAVALASDTGTAIVGADGDESAYVLDSAGGSWSQQAKLTADDADRDDKFGCSVAVSADGTTALVGAEEDRDPNGFLAGSVYVFDGTGGSWRQEAKIAADDGGEADRFGHAVAVSNAGTTALISAKTDTGPHGSGTAYRFAVSDGSWSQQSKLAAADGDQNDKFGESVALSSDGTVALIGDNQDEEPNGFASGSAYIFSV